MAATDSSGSGMIRLKESLAAGQGDRPGKVCFRRPVLGLAVFAALYGALATALSYYVYGGVNHPEQLALIFRELDSAYLVNDFFVNSGSGFGPRFYYTQALAAAGAVIPLPLLFFILYLAVQIAVAAVTAFAARDLTGSTLAGFLAAVLAVSLTPFHLADYPARVIEPALLPHFLATPLFLLALWKGIRGEPVGAAVFSLPAILIHPVVGVEIAFLAMAAVTARRLFPQARHPGGWRQGILRRDLGIALAILGLTLILFWIIPLAYTADALRLTDREFVQIYSYVRIPHHTLPSSWPRIDFLLAAFFLGAALMALAAFRNAPPAGSRQRDRATAMAAIFLVVVVGMLGSWFFVEVIPHRWAATAAFFRMAVYATWLGWIVIAGQLAGQLAQRQGRWTLLGLVSALAAPALFLYQGIRLAAGRREGGQWLRSGPGLALAALLVVAALVGSLLFIAALRPELDTYHFPLTLVGLALALSVAWRPRRLPAALAGLGGVLLLTITVLALERYAALPEIPLVSRYVRTVQPALTLEDYKQRFREAPATQLAAVARRETDRDAVFLIPWRGPWLNWRLFAERAPVLGWKAYPFRDAGLREWHQRYLDIYDRERGVGYPFAVSAAELLTLQRKYPFDYAVLPVDSDLPFPTLATAGGWKLVKVNPEPGPADPESGSRPSVLK